MKPSWMQPLSEWKMGKLQTLTKRLQRLPSFRRKEYASEEEPYEMLPDWRTLADEFFNRTTWHGLKYISIPSRFVIRRILWVLVLLSNATLFFYIMTTRKDHLMSYPSTITVEVSYKDVLPFSAITICNYNQYRLTAMQEIGLYDLLVNDLPGTQQVEKGCDFYQFYPGICRIPSDILLADEGNNIVILNETTRSVCRRVCYDAYDWYCSGFLYDRRYRSCVLSPYTGEWMEPNQPICNTSDGLEFYRRNRCASADDVRCNFEDSYCSLTNDTTKNDQWMIVEARGHAVQTDNTLDLPSGHVANLLLTELRPNYRARLQSVYMNTTGRCIELFYWLQVNDSTTSESATLSVILITEEREEIVLRELSKGPKDWSGELIQLPDGIYQVVIEGRRGSFGQSGLSIDDVAIQDCKKFTSNRNCKVTRKGRAYLGTMNMTAQGEPCLPWETIDSPLVNRLPDNNEADASNYCRNIPQQDWSEPSCFVQTKAMTVRAMPCDIPYCECPGSSYFKCDNGLCLPLNLICNGVDDCLDGSDEHGVCNSTRSIECYFDADYKCGYESNQVGALFFSRVSASDLRYYYGASVIAANVSALEQLMLVDSKLGQMGDQVQLVSPLWTFKEPTMLSLTYIMMGTDPQPPDSHAGLYLYQYSELHVPVRQLFNATSFKARDLQVSYVCVPSGTYHLMFLGVQGIPYESDFALDIVLIDKTCDYEEVKEDVSFDCSFRTMCGYKFISTSALLSWSLIYTRTAFLDSDENKVCNNVFGGIEGLITSPGYPDNYANNLSCSFSIEEADGVTIIITFLEFSVESESDCRFDRLEITDPVANRTKVYCGGKDDLPPAFESKGNILNFLFVTDSDVNAGRFKLEYTTTILPDHVTNFALALKYSGLRPSTDYTLSSKLISPAVQLTGDSCVTMVLMVNANFTIKMAYLSSGVYTERLLLTSPLPLGRTWQQLHLNASPAMTDSAQFVLVFESASAGPGTEAAMISDVKLLNGTCRDVVTNGILSCEFTDFNQCGYLDSSKDTIRWLRVYDQVSDTYFMRATFSPQQPDEAVLTSVRSEVTSPQCLKITYFSPSLDINIRVESQPPGFLTDTNTSAGDTDPLTFGNAYMQRNLPIGNYSIVIRASLDGDSLSTAMQEVKLYRIEVLDGECAFNDTLFKSYCTFDNPNLCGYTVNYPCGSPWTWAKFENILVKDINTNMSNGSFYGMHNNVMLYNGSSDHPLKGVILTSRMVKEREELMMIEAYTTSQTGDASIKVYLESTWGHQFHRLHIDGDLTQNQWTNLSVCLPKGTFRVMILATTSLAQFVAIDNVYLSSVSCSVSDPELPACEDSDKSNCPEYYFSWSPQFDWRYTADIRNNTVLPGGDGCVRVYYEIEGIILYNETGKQFESPSCDIYIKGLTTFTVKLWFEEFEFRNCSREYLEIWRYDGDNFTDGGEVFCNNTRSAPLVVQTNKVIQIRVFAFNGFPSFRLRYAYTPIQMTGLFLALHYIDTQVSGTYSINRVAQWASAASVPTSDYVCLELDMSFPSSMLEVVFIQTDVQNKTSVSKTILRRIGIIRDDHVGWVHGSFEVPVDTNWTGHYQFVFYVSIVNATFIKNVKTFVGALNSIFIYDGRCYKPNPKTIVPIDCRFSQNDTCGYQDASQDSSRWMLQSKRATYSSPSGGCKVSLYGQEYVGNISQTISGRECQRWDSQTPHTHNQDVADYFPDLSLEDAANHCSNPSNPFIVRTSWCYTMDPRQRREYCDIPYCLEYLMEAQMLANSANRAILISPPLYLTRPACLSFKYQLTSSLVELTVKRMNDSISIPEILQTYTIPREPTTYIWREGRLALDAGTTQVRFVADKIDFTERDQFVSLDNVTIVSGDCPVNESAAIEMPTVAVFMPVCNIGTLKSDSPMDGNRVPYLGLRLSRDAYIEIILKGLGETDMTTLTSIMAHQLPQLIHKCDYGQQPCYERDFLTEFTDMGQCYTFNYNQSDFRYAYTTGAESGARFILNVEQYEHVKNYVSGTGMKMHLHDQADVASIRDLGVAAMPGVHNLATISYTQSESLIPPFGSCGSVDLPYYDEDDDDGNDYDDGNTSSVTYTEAKCRLQRKTQFVEEKCKCKDINMPGPSPFCSLDQHISCIKQVTETSQNISSSAVCPTACNVNSFTLGLSQSQLSGLSINDILGNKTEDLSQRYIQALEIRNRVDEDTMTTTIIQMEYVISSHVKLQSYIYFAVLDRGTSIPRHIEAALEDITELVLNDIVNGGGALLSRFETAYLMDLKPRESYLEEITTRLHAKLSLTKDLLKGLSVGIYNPSDKWYFTVVVETLELLKDFSRVLTTYTTNTASSTTDLMPKLFEVEPCKSYLDSIIGNDFLLIIQLRVLTIKGSFDGVFPCDTCVTVALSRMEDLLLYLSNFSNCHSVYSDFLVDFRRWLGSVSFDLREFSNSINSEQVLNMFLHNEYWLTTLKTNYSKNAIMKLDLAKQLNSERSATLSQDITNVVQDISQQIVVPLQNKITSTEDSIAVMYLTFLEYCVKLSNYTMNSEVERYARSLQMWRKPIPELEIPEMLEFTLSEDETWQIWPTEESIKSFVEESAKARLTLVSMVYFSQLSRQLTEFLTAVNGYQNELSTALQTIKQSLQQYIDSTIINENFVMKNFLMLDIYYGEMKYEHISQSEAYTWTNFFSDLGSYFGLLMGCSLLTMIEVIDLFVYYSIVKLIERYQKVPPVREVIEVNHIGTTHM